MKELFAISSGSNIAKAKPIASSQKDVGSNVEGDKASSSKDFLSIMFEQIKQSVKQEASVIDLKSANTDIKTNVDKKDSKKSLDEHLLGDILEIISVIKGSSETAPSFPTLTKGLEKLINSDVSIKELKNINNMSDLLKLSKKYNLGLEKISVKKLDLKSLQKEFPNLDKKSFFELPKETKNIVQKETQIIDNKQKIEIKPAKLSFNNIQKPIQKKDKEPSILEKAISSSKSKEKVTAKVIQEVKTPKENVVTKVIQEVKVPKENIVTKVEQEAKALKDNITTKDNTATKAIKEIKAPKEEIVTKIIQEVKIKDPKITKVKNVKIEKNIQDKGLIENVLQNLKNDKPTTKVTSNLKNIEKTLSDETKKVEKTETKTENSTKTELKMPIKTENISNKEALPAKQTFSSFANDLREKIDNYKPPMMKMQIALNPKELGEVKVTLLNRGNSLHVNISSNTNSMAIFTQNQAEFKNSLVNMGFTNLQMNFSDQKGQDNQQNTQHNSSHKEINDDDENQDIKTEEKSIELIIPQYV